MKIIKPIVIAGDMEIISIFDAPYFIKSQYKKGEVLFGYEFFIIIPGEVTLPISDLFFEIQDPKSNSLERVGLALLEVLDIENIKESFKTHLVYLDTPEGINNHINQETGIDEYKYWYQEGLKYIKGKESNAIVGCEFMY